MGIFFLLLSSYFHEFWDSWHFPFMFLWQTVSLCSPGWYRTCLVLFASATKFLVLVANVGINTQSDSFLSVLIMHCLFPVLRISVVVYGHTTLNMPDHIWSDWLLRTNEDRHCVLGPYSETHQVYWVKLLRWCLTWNGHIRVVDRIPTELSSYGKHLMP